MDRLKDLWIDIEIDTLNKVFISATLILTLVVINTLVRVLIQKNVKDPKLRYSWSRVIDYTFVFVGIFFVGKVWFKGFETIATFLGLLSAGIAIALKDIMLNMAGWLYIIWRKPFVVGQRIQMGENKGDVIDIRVFQFTILEIGNWVAAEQSTGRMVHIPNGLIFTTPVKNYESGFTHIWNEQSFTITFESNWQKAKALVLEILQNTAPQITDKLETEIKEATKHYLIYYKHLTPIVYTGVNQRGVEFFLRYICMPRERRKVETAIWEEILATFAQHSDIQWAYPTTRFFENKEEGKVGGKQW